MANINKTGRITALFAVFFFSSSMAMAEVTKTTTPSSPPATTEQTQQPTTKTDQTKKTKKDKKDEENPGSSMISMATMFMTTVAPTGSTMMMSDDKKAKLIIDAKSDAAAYIASNGKVRGAYLESAIQMLRKDASVEQADDTQLAQAILSW